METFGIDISHHQGGSLNFVALRNAGIRFVFIKATESSGFKDSQFTTNLKRAQDAGMVVAAYHYVRSGVTAAAQVANVLSMVPKSVPVIPDVEANSGGVTLLRDFIAQLRNAGYRVPLLYLPRWYWQQIGSPSLAGLPPLWSSRYPDNIPDTIPEEYKDVPSSYWNGYGGLGVKVLQFTSSAMIAGVRLDANVFQGTPEQLAALLGGQEEDDMAGEGPNILAALMTGGDSTRGITTDETGKVIYPTGVDPTSILGRLADIQIALTRDLPKLLTKAAADLDEEALAAAMAKQGIGGVTPAQVKAALREVLASAGKTPEGE